MTFGRGARWRSCVAVAPRLSRHQTHRVLVFLQVPVPALERPFVGDMFSHVLYVANLPRGESGLDM